MKVKTQQVPTEIHIDELRLLLEEARSRPLTEAECDQLLSVATSYCEVGTLLADKRATIAKLRKMLFGSSTERTSAVLDEQGAAKTADGEDAAAMADAKPGEGEPADAADQPKPKGHGRNGAEAYDEATRERIQHATLKAGDKCPECPKGVIYKLAEPAVRVRVYGGPPLHAHVCELERLRCNLCNAIFTATAPAGLGDAKYDPTAVTMIGLLRYGTGVPFHRLAKLENDLGVPLPTSTQWDLVAGAAKQLTPAFEELIQKAAQGEVVHNDDTRMKILALQAELRARTADEVASDKRTGIFTTGILAKVGERRIALFFTGRQHAGENLAEVLQRRAAERPPPLQMCDGLLHNLPKELDVILSNCLVHGRRQFVDIFDAFPAPCRHVLEAIREVYRHDATAKQLGLSPKERLSYHQTHSGTVMAELKQWLDRQIVDRLVEPNSGLGKAIEYLRKRWEPLTVFLRRPGAPLDNNVCEQALKRAIIHRKNSLFYKTENGARVGDTFMSLIHTAELCGANPFDYLTALQRHADAVAADPAAWMPWNYHDQLAAGGATELRNV